MLEEAEAYLVRAKKEAEATTHKPTIRFRRPAAARRTKSIPPPSTAIADPPEKAAEICAQQK